MGAGYPDAERDPDPACRIEQRAWPQISPDGRWFAYQSTDFGGTEIYLHGPFDPPSAGQRTKPVSGSDGGWVRWRADGRELYYVTPDGTLMAVALPSIPAATSSRPQHRWKLFNAPMNMGSINQSIGRANDMPDKTGERFLVLLAEPAKSAVHVLGHDISNWRSVSQRIQQKAATAMPERRNSLRKSALLFGVYKRQWPGRVEAGNFGDHRSLSQRRAGAADRCRAWLPGLLRACWSESCPAALRQQRSTQETDIARACECWLDWQRRELEEE